uniref:Beta-defensin-like domain-containing protein n=1 Tax=Jaculus jaculus TaxID=51337 RepID=A0A8C5K0C8_JACJA
MKQGLLSVFTIFLFAAFLFLGDVPPGIRDTICLLQNGHCRLFFCNAGEKKGDMCSSPWNKCCIPSKYRRG